MNHSTTASIAGAPVPSATSILSTISHLIERVVEGDIQASEIGLETSFSQDLELESIEFVALAEELQNTFGMEIAFTRWLGGMSLDEILALRVGDLVEFVQRCLI